MYLKYIFIQEESEEEIRDFNLVTTMLEYSISVVTELTMKKRQKDLEAVKENKEENFDKRIKLNLQPNNEFDFDMKDLNLEELGINQLIQVLTYCGSNIEKLIEQSSNEQLQIAEEQLEREINKLMNTRKLVQEEFKKRKEKNVEKDDDENQL